MLSFFSFGTICPVKIFSSQFHIYTLVRKDYLTECVDVKLRHPSGSSFEINLSDRIYTRTCRKFLDLYRGKPWEF